MSIKDAFKKPQLPNVTLEYTLGDKLLDIASGMCIVAFWIYVWMAFNQLPAEIPTHFDAAGKVDGMSSRSMILFLPGIATLSAVILTIMNQYPHKMNYAVKITPENALRQYRNGMTLIRVIRLSVILVFFVIAYFIIHAGANDQGGKWLLPVVLALTLVPTFYFVVRSVMMK